MLFLYARGGAAWVLGFVALVPWLRTLDGRPTATSAARTLLNAYVMCVALTAAMYTWFGLAMGRYAQVNEAAGLGVLLLMAPLFQPQVLVFALVRRVALRQYGAVTGALAGGAAWVATEWALPKVLGDTLGHGLYPSALLRQAADLGGAAGLTLLLLCANEAVSVAWARRADGVRAVARPPALAALVPLLLAGYGLTVPSELPAPAGQRLRMGLVQSNIVDYERLRREKGAGAVVREVLDTHYAMSHDAVERQQVQALLWSETVYPTTFGHPKSEAGAELDREILGIVNAAGVPLVFGTYDRDPDRDPERDPGGAGGAEYNAAAFVAPGVGLVGVYRKTRLFPFTEALPAWLEGPLGPLGSLARRWLPWAGTWRPGTGARVFPLRLADGREVPVLPLICLDDVDTGLAIDGARLGAMVILTMSNDSWFTEHPQGARLHQAVAAFRSVETRLPQFRVTSNGYSAVIDARGEVLVGTRHGERTLVVGELPVREPTRTLMVAWGDWVGRAGAVFLLALGVLWTLAGWRAWRSGLNESTSASASRSRSASTFTSASAPAPAPSVSTALPARLAEQVAVLTPAVRLAAGGLRAFAYGSLLWLAATVVAGEGALASNTLAQIRAFIALVLAPEAAARGLLWASRATLSLQWQEGLLVLTRGTRRIELALGEVVAVRAWRVPSPGPGVSLQLASGAMWRYALAHVDAVALQSALAAQAALSAPSTQEGDAGDAGAAVKPVSPAWAARYAQACLAPRGSRFLNHAFTKFVLFPCLLAIPAFRLHQHIAFGGGLGEYQLFGLMAYAKGFGLWWAAWAIGVVMVAAVLRAAIESSTLAVVLWRPARVLDVRQGLERLGLAALYLGIPAWLALRFVGG